MECSYTGRAGRRSWLAQSLLSTYRPKLNKPSSVLLKETKSRDQGGANPAFQSPGPPSTAMARPWISCELNTLRK